MVQPMGCLGHAATQGCPTKHLSRPGELNYQSSFLQTDFGSKDPWKFQEHQWTTNARTKRITPDTIAAIHRKDIPLNISLASQTRPEGFNRVWR